MHAEGTEGACGILTSGSPKWRQVPLTSRHATSPLPYKSVYPENSFLVEQGKLRPGSYSAAPVRTSFHLFLYP